MKLFTTFKNQIYVLRKTIPLSGFVLMFLMVFVIWFNFYNQLWKEEHGVVKHDVICRRLSSNMI